MNDIQPIAFVTGYIRGYPTIKTLDPSLVLPPKMALYSYEDVLNAVQAERESCAKLVEDFIKTAELAEWEAKKRDWTFDETWQIKDLMAAIRAKGEVK